MNLPIEVKEKLELYPSQHIYDTLYTFVQVDDCGILDMIYSTKCNRLKDVDGNVYNKQKGYDKFCYYSCVFEDGTGYLLFPLNEKEFWKIFYKTLV